MSRFRRRLMGLAQLRESKRKDFVRVEYIENTSTAYIDTRIIANQNTNYEIKVQFTKSTGYPYIFGAQQADRERRFSLMEGSWKAFYYSTNLHTQEINLSLTEEQQTSNLVVKKDGLIMYVDGEKKGTFSNTTFTTPSTLTIFTCHYANGGVHNNVYKGRLYYFKIYDGTTLVRDYIPMYQISTDTYGLWDRVNEEFYTSPNGVKFTGGERVVADANDNLYYIKSYIKCNGTTNTFINLSKFTNLDNVEFEVYSNTAHDNFIGSRSGTPTRNHFQISKWTNTRMDIAFGQQSPASITSKNTGSKKFKIKLWERIIYLDNEKFYTCPNNTFTTNTVVSLGAVKGLAQNTSARFYWFKWWNKDKDLIYDMIPVQRISDGVWGMFCKVHLGFYPSNGSAQFTGG